MMIYNLILLGNLTDFGAAIKLQVQASNKQ